MKLNPDCVRDILLYLEENLFIDNNKFSSITLRQLKDAFTTEYLEDDVFYSVYNLNKIKYIEGKISDVNDMKMFFCEIENITWHGHQFLNDIRPKTVWEATKSGAMKLGTMSIHALTTISSSLVQAICSNPQVIAGLIKGMGM